MPELYRFYQANIHEHRPAAIVCRCAPIVVFILVIIISIVCLWQFPEAFLVIAAVFNVSMWVNIVHKAWFCLSGIREVQKKLDAYEAEGPDTDQGGSRAEPLIDSDGSSRSSRSSRSGREETSATVGTSFETGAATGPRSSHSSAKTIAHLIVIPNYKEDEEMLAQTLESLSQAKTAQSFRIVLAMESREGEEAEKKGNRLRQRFQDCFAQVVIASHPKTLTQSHLDGSEEPEVPGKASNLKWAVINGFEQCLKTEKLDPVDVLLTVADADCMFHPGYFSHIAEECDEMRRRPGNQHIWTMWQAPQLAYRNYYESPVCSRIWGMIAAIYEFGGVCSLMGGGHHMVFSAYSLHMQLALAAGAWDGDVIAEDHHAFIKCWFYSLHKSATDLMAGKRVQRVCRARLKIRPVFLPVKSLSVVSATYWQTWWDRFDQAKRHCQGVAELSYALLATYDTLRSLPRQMRSMSVIFGLLRVNGHLWFTHLVPQLQAVVLGELSLWWMWNLGQLPNCPDRIWLVPRHETFLCGLAGAWALVWPVVVPLILIWFANFRFLSRIYIQPADRLRSSLWYTQDGGIPRDRFNRHTIMGGMLLMDCFCCPPLMLIYGFLPCMMAYVNLVRNGNRFNYVTAAKGAPKVQELEMISLSA